MNLIVAALRPKNRPTIQENKDLPVLSTQVPVDAPSTVRIEHCIKAQYVLHRMQFRETKLNLLLLDMCREFNNIGGVPGDIQPVKSRGNTAIGYAW